MTDHALKLKPQWFQILVSLADRDLHGSAIMEDVLERTHGEMKLWPGTLYGALSDMTERGFITETEPPPNAPTEGGRRKFYAITPEGRDALSAEVDRLAELVRVARARVADG